MKGPELCKVTDNRLIAGGMYKLRLEAPNVAGNARPGQFIHIKVPGDRSRLLRRPISIYDACHKKGYVEIVFQVVGEGTRLLSAVKTGDFLDVLGPLGNGFSVSGDTRHLFVVGGGCGAAPVKLQQADSILPGALVSSVSKAAMLHMICRNLKIAVTVF